VHRRAFLAGTGAVLLSAPRAAEAQQAAKIARIGFLTFNTGANPHLREAFLQGLRALADNEPNDEDATHNAGQDDRDRDDAPRVF
jgi:hypothetical protein